MPSTWAAMVWKMACTRGQAAGLPPGMIDGPRRAPSSPPETPVPTNRMPRSARARVRRVLSGKWELPPSMMTSPGAEQRDQGLDELIHHRTGADHEHDLPRSGQGRDQLLEGMGADDLGPGGGTGEELVHLAGGAVEHGHPKAMVVHVEGQVLAHDRQADEPDVRTCHEGLLKRRDGNLTDLPGACRAEIATFAPAL